jgi:hypothetical protein
MLESRLTELESGARARIAAAATPQELESVRVEVLGRKGVLADASKQSNRRSSRRSKRVRRSLPKQRSESASTPNGWI